MDKLTSNFIIKQYQSGVESYASFTTEVGLWESEKYVFEKYLKKTDQILDIGCGTGRTTFDLYGLGFKDIVGIDLTPEMIQKANELNKYFQLEIPFHVGDATDLNYEDERFDSVIFSFNGMMSIPSQQQRSKALSEINRVLKVDGIFIFTTHDREQEEAYLEFWKQQKVVWDQAKQNPKLYEFGDIITTSKNEQREIYIHIPNQAEIQSFLKNGNFEVLETFYRSDQFEEKEKVKEKSGECRFWVVKKINHQHATK